jgi:arsenite methyltransferase
MKSKADYGLDAPVVVRRLALGGLALVSVGLALHYLPTTADFRWLRQWALGGLSSGVGCLLTAGVMVWGSKIGKLRLRDRVLATFSWRGDERVLDVGCGHGLMLIGAANHLTRGKALGLDLWKKEDQAGNSRAATQENVQREGVADRVELHDGDARALPFADGSFDLVLSSWALHNIYEGAGRAQAVREICRVLQPGGRVALTDIRHAAEYAREFQQAGMVNVRRSWPNFLFVTPTVTVFAEKPPVSSVSIASL